MNIEKLYQQNFFRITFYVNRIIENWHDAEDITQDVFSKFLTLDVKIPVSEEIYYLYRMAKNSCINYIRRKECRDRYLDSLDSEEWVDMTPKYDEQFQLARVYKEIEKMKDCKYKTILKYHYIRGLSYEEISSELRIAKDALRKNKLFGLDKLREKFGGLKK